MSVSTRKARYCHPLWSGSIAGAPCTANASCTPAGRCVCDAPAFAAHYDCALGKWLCKIAESAWVDEPCSQTGPLCQNGNLCMMSKCACPTGTEPIASVAQGKSECRTKSVPPASTCAHGELCTGGSVCLNTVCTCKAPADQVMGGSFLSFIHKHINRWELLRHISHRRPVVQRGESVPSIGQVDVCGRCVHVRRPALLRRRLEVVPIQFDTRKQIMCFC